MLSIARSLLNILDIGQYEKVMQIYGGTFIKCDNESAQTILSNSKYNALLTDSLILVMMLFISKLCPALSELT